MEISCTKPIHMPANPIMAGLCAYIGVQIKEEGNETFQNFILPWYFQVKYMNMVSE